MTDISVTSPVERIARVIAAEALSANGTGDERSAAPDVDDSWREQLPTAIAILRTLREATPEMVEAGRDAADDPAEMWTAMVLTALEDAA